MPRPELMGALLPTALLVASALARFASAQALGGFAYDVCKAGQQCQPGLVCQADTGTTVCLDSSARCLCTPTDVEARKCSASTTCITGERCVGIPEFDFNVCISCQSWSSIDNATLVDRDGASCLTDANNYVSGYTGDDCTDSSELPRCIAPRECYFEDPATPSFFKLCAAARTPAERRLCRCRDFPVSTCTASTECPYGERCVRNGTTNAICISCRATELEISLSPIDDGVERCLLPNSPPSPSPAPPSSDRAPYRGGFAWDLCTVDKDRANVSVSATCPEEHFCASLEGAIPSLLGPPPCQSGERNCFCSFVNVRRCIVSTDCILGERCVDINDGMEAGLRVCAGCRRTELQRKRKLWSPVDPDDNCIPLSAPPSPSPSHSPEPVKSSAPSPGAYPRGFTFDNCIDDRSVCREPRRCAVTGSERPCGRDDDACNCFPPETELKECKASKDCDGGERCADVLDLGNVCVSCTVESEYVLVDDDEANCLRGIPSMQPTSTPSVSTVSPEPLESSPEPSPDAEMGPNTNSDSGVCIGTHHLQALRAADLVFATHRVGHVLCDDRGSCATAGHIVTFRGRAMRMRAYCDNVAVGGCEAKRMTVNSPRWQAARRVASHTDGLEFTALAARWDSHVEERLLKLLVHLGA